MIKNKNFCLQAHHCCNKYSLRIRNLLPAACYLQIIILLLFSSCIKINQNNYEDNYASFNEVPGVTIEEINAIEKFQQQGVSFIYGATPSTEAFYNEDGILSGFTILFCEWMTELFDIPFVPKLYDWDEVLEGLESGKIDFTGELTATPKRRETYIMTDAIATRFITYFRIAGSEPLANIEKSRPARYGFFSGTITLDDVESAAYEEYSSHQSGIAGNFISFFADNYDEAYNLLITGEVDAFLDEHTSEAAFENYGNVVTEDFFPLIFSPVSLATQKPENAAIISVMQKVLQNGGDNRLLEMYNHGETAYRKHKLFTRLTQEEKSYIRNNPTVKFAAEHDNYPISFYNSYDKEFQGICYDVIKGIEAITGLAFVHMNNQYDNWADLIKMLEDGKVSMISELILTPEREGRFLWPKDSILTDYYALLSKDEYRNIRTREIMHVKVGLVEGYAQMEIFKRWFPDHTNTVIYDNYNQAFDALGRDEIDMVMGSQNQLLVMTNFYELPGYKANIVFNYPYESTFGFNINETVLCSIIDKAIQLIDTKGIEKQWTSRTYDYRVKIAQAHLAVVVSIVCAFILILFVLSVMFYSSRQYAQIQEQSRSKSLFLANMSHEIRTPMNAITGMAEMLLRGDLSDEMRCYAQDIKHAGKNLISIINDILDISKIEAGKFEIIPVPYLLSSLVNDTVNIIRSRLQDKLLWFETNIDKTIPNNLIGDEVRLRQICINLLSNAVKYTDKGGINFSISIDKMEEPASVSETEGKVWLKITVTDTGKGIKQEDQNKLFNKFVQVDKERNIGIEGTGLGLAITKQLCDAMGGKVSVESEYGKGSTFTVIIPQSIASLEPIEEMEFASDFNEDDVFTIKNIFPNSRILVVDDLPVNLKVVEGLLTPYKTAVDVCSNGAEAVELVKYKKYDLIFMDHMMPGMDGIEATARIRAWEKDRAAGEPVRDRVPIIALTANAVAGMKEMFKKNDLDDFLAKPIDIIKLDEILNRWINNKEEIKNNKEEYNSDGNTVIKDSSFTIGNHKPKTFTHNFFASIPIRKHYRKLVLGLFILSFGIVLAVSFTANKLIAFSLHTMEFNIEQRLITVAERLAESVSIEELDQYKEIEDMDLPSYQALRLELAEYSKKAELLYVYFMRPKTTESGQNALYYIIDNDFNEETRVGLDSPTDHILDDIPWLKPVLNGATVYAGLGVYTYGWDGLLSAYAPIFDSGGNVAAVAGVDIEDAVIIQARQLLSILTIVQIIMVAVVFISGLFALIRFQKEAEAANKANAIKEDFLAKMSYELLTPMNTIIGMTELILREEIPNEVREHIQDIRYAGANLTSIIKNILDFSEKGMNRTKLTYNKLFASLFNRTIDTTASKLSIKGIDTAKGLAMTGGKTEKYKQVLAVFSENAQERLSILQTAPDETTLNIFITQVHALKSSLGTIGALDMPAQAAALEEAGNDRNFDLIREKLPSFAEKLQELINNINTFLQTKTI